MSASKRIQKLLKITLIVFMLVAGINHFLNPQFYIPLIPDYLPYPQMVNSISGILEVVLALLLITKTTKRLASYGLIALLLLFIPSHIYFIQIGACVENGLCTPIWVAWTRLILVHPLLMLWIWKVGDY